MTRPIVRRSSATTHEPSNRRNVLARTHEMARTITIADDVYEALSSLKEPGESFSDVVRRLTEEVNERRLLAAAGAWKDLPIDAAKMKREIRSRRDETRDPKAHF